MLNSDYRSMFVIFVIQNLEGERYYGEQTLVTPVLQRSHFLRGVVHMVLVGVKVQGVETTFLNINQKSCLYDHQTMKCKCLGVWPCANVSVVSM